MDWKDHLKGLEKMRDGTRPSQERPRQCYANGGSIKDKMKALASEGRRGDTQLAYIGSKTARFLDDLVHGGRREINPRTGLREYMTKRSIKPKVNTKKQSQKLINKDTTTVSVPTTNPIVQNLLRKSTRKASEKATQKIKMEGRVPTVTPTTNFFQQNPMLAQRLNNNAPQFSERTINNYPFVPQNDKPLACGLKAAQGVLQHLVNKNKLTPYEKQYPVYKEIKSIFSKQDTTPEQISQDLVTLANKEKRTQKKFNINKSISSKKFLNTLGIGARYQENNMQGVQTGKSDYLQPEFMSQLMENEMPLLMNMVPTFQSQGKGADSHMMTVSGIRENNNNNNQGGYFLDVNNPALQTMTTLNYPFPQQGVPLGNIQGVSNTETPLNFKPAAYYSITVPRNKKKIGRTINAKFDSTLDDSTSEAD